VNKRNGSEIEQLSVAIGMARKQNYSFFGRDVDVVWWSVAAKAYIKLILTHNNSVAQMQLNLHIYTLSHHRKTRREYCRKLVPCRCTATLQKACRITQSQSGIAHWVELCQMRQGHRYSAGLNNSSKCSNCYGPRAFWAPLSSVINIVYYII